MERIGRRVERGKEYKLIVFTNSASHRSSYSHVPPVFMNDLLPRSKYALVLAKFLDMQLLTIRCSGGLRNGGRVGFE